MSDIFGIGQGVSGAAQAGATIASAGIQAAAAEAAAQTQADAAKYAVDKQDSQYQQTRTDYAPWRVAGGGAVTRQADLMGLNGQAASDNAFATFREDPGYKYTVDQAVQGVDRSAAARGLLTSGATIKAIQDRAGNLADQQYGNWFNRFGVIAGTGQTATAGTASAGANAANNAGNAMIQAGQARASGYTGVASAVNQGLNNYFAKPSSGGGGGSNGWFDSSWGNPGSYSGDGNGEFYGL
jgi:hypothetical protein